MNETFGTVLINFYDSQLYCQYRFRDNFIAILRNPVEPVKEPPF